MPDHHDEPRPESEHHRISPHVPGLRWDPAKIPAWLRMTSGEPRWPVTLGVLLAIALQLALPDRYALQPRYLLPVLEVLLLGGLIAANPVRFQREHPLIHWASIVLTLTVAGTNFGSIGRLVHQILHHHTGTDPADYAQILLGSGLAIWITNVLAYALFYWQFDRGGPFSRAQARKPYPDFLFPQMTDPSKAHDDWEPGFVDYAYLSFTNSTAFSPTDTLPMSSWAKLMMMSQSVISLITVALVAARAVNVLP